MVPVPVPVPHNTDSDLLCLDEDGTYHILTRFRL
jgi:hypothetical protein